MAALMVAAAVAAAAADFFTVVLFDGAAADPRDQLIKPGLAKTASPILPIGERPQIVGIGAHLVEVAHLEEEDVTRGVPFCAASLRVIAVARPNCPVAVVGLKIPRSFCEANNCSCPSVPLTGQAAHDGTRLPLHVSADVVRDQITVEAQNVDACTDTSLRMPRKILLRVVLAVLVDILIEPPEQRARRGSLNERESAICSGLGSFGSAAL